MSIVSHEGRHQVCCDSCPASYPNTYRSEDWDVMIADAKTAGWIIRKAAPPREDERAPGLFGRPEPRIAGKEQQPYTHTCPACAGTDKAEGRLF